MSDSLQINQLVPRQEEYSDLERKFTLQNLVIALKYSVCVSLRSSLVYKRLQNKNSRFNNSGSHPLTTETHHPLSNLQFFGTHFELWIESRLKDWQKSFEMAYLQFSFSLTSYLLSFRPIRLN